MCKFHLCIVNRGKKEEERAKLFILYARAREVLYKVLFGAVMIELEPDIGQLLCHLGTGIGFDRIDALCNDKKR